MMGPDFDLELIALLNKNNYALRRKIGEGYFRVAYEVVRHKGELKRRFVAKWEKPKDNNSAQHKINQSKKDLSVRELEALNSIHHPNIVQIYDLLQDEKRKVIIEEHFDAISLEDKVQLQGAIRNPAFFKHIFSQAIDALRYLHVGGGMLHRDLKPSNILIGRQNDLVKVADFQLAGLASDMETKLLPTRGATGYTHPDLINALLTGYPNCASISSEFYALGATIFYALAGKPLFDYKINLTDEGMPLAIDDEKFYIALEERGRKSVFIAPEEHELQLQHRVEQVPVNFRELLTNCLSLERRRYSSLNAEEAHTQFREDFEYATGVLQSVVPLHKILSPEIAAAQNGNATPELDAAIETAVDAAMKYGKREKENRFQHHGSGSDQILSSTTNEIYSLNTGKFTLKLKDEADYYSFGTWSPGWREDYHRTLEIHFEGERILEAHKSLGGEAGILHEQVHILEPYDHWLITEVKPFSLENLSGRQGELPWQVTKVGKLEEQVRKSQRERSGCTLEVPKNGNFDIDYIKEHGYQFTGASGKIITCRFYGQENEDKIVLEPEIE